MAGCRRRRSQSCPRCEGARPRWARTSVSASAELVACERETFGRERRLWPVAVGTAGAVTVLGIVAGGEGLPGALPDELAPDRRHVLGHDPGEHLRVMHRLAPAHRLNEGVHEPD